MCTLVSPRFVSTFRVAADLRSLRLPDLSPLSDPSRWVFPVDDTKSTGNWNCEWGVDDDAKLVVGVWKHGHGNWDAIQKDATLGLQDKFFLEDAKIKTENSEKRLPNSIHLVRRADYLTHLLREEHQARGGPSNQGRGSYSSSRPPARPKATTERSHDSTTKSKPKKKATPEYSSSEEEAYDSMDEKECKEILRPVKRELKRLKLDTVSYSREQKVAHLKECLSAIGARIEYSASQEKTSSAKDKRRKHLCEYQFLYSDPQLTFRVAGVWTTHFWPAKIKWEKLRGV